MESKQTYLSELNAQQQEAVLYNDGPSLVVAGAGSGKTRVLTYKIACLLERGLPPYSILALTFTNKAAREMKSRIAALTDERTAMRLWMGTFHSIFYRILRYESEAIGYPHDFTIYDTSDSKSLIRSILKEMQLDEKVYRPGMIQSRISNAKNALITCHAYVRNETYTDYDAKAHIPFFSEVYSRYQARCFQAGAMDFDELLVQTNILFRDHPDILEKYRQKFLFVLVDEYQDTNFAQHLIVTRLCEAHRRICVVGDDAQSIYSFRGANIDNMLRFKDHYPECRIFKLEQNYRSTQNIVNAANSLINKNKGQIRKTVYSQNEPGSKIGVVPSYSDYEEGYVIASLIGDMRRREQCAFADFAVLYRTNAQSRVIEDALRSRGIAYRVYGSQSFYQRKEVKDIIAYFRTVVNPHDEEALKRIVNFPARGIGETTVGKLMAAAARHQVSAWTVLCAPDATYGVSVNEGTFRKLREFGRMMQGLIDERERLTAVEMAELVVTRSGIATVFFQDRTAEGLNRQENLQEVLKAVAEFCNNRREEGVERVSLADFLVEVSLISDQDQDAGEQVDRVTLMTVHAAKGLEFDHVVVAGMEDNLFPSLMSQDERGIEEERRLFYVAITRARRSCVVTYAKSRFRNGKTGIGVPSRFLDDIDPQFLDMPEVREVPRVPAGGGRQGATAGGYFPHDVREIPGVSRMRSVRTYVSREDEKVQSLCGFSVGETVRHERFGRGEILLLEGGGADARAVIRFEHLGEKSLLLKYARLIKVDS
ncbi:MAG: UvrD-helicase domain-containing protein [Tannerella sp.]|jgi:DNA helicase-2/ATP-dependent DNA helicase PcrA|nr:UvrD-helicase domain-containing protein [Tannerella sp.]